MDLFGNMLAILNCTVSNSYCGMLSASNKDRRHYNSEQQTTDNKVAARCWTQPHTWATRATHNTHGLPTKTIRTTSSSLQKRKLTHRKYIKQ